MPPLPIDPAYTAAESAANLQRQTTQNAALQQRQSGLLDYGYRETGYNPASGTPFGTVQVDPNNPFSKAALLKQNYDISRRRAGQTMGAGGGLYSGAYQNQQDFVNRGELQAQNDLQSSLTKFLAQNTTDYTGAGVTEQNALSQAMADRMSRISDNPFYQPEALAALRTPAPRAVRPAVRPAARPTTKPAAKKVFYWPGSTTPHTVKYAQAPKAAQVAHAKAFPKAQKRYVAKVAAKKKR